MLRVRDIMTTDVVTVSPQATLREVAELLSARHVSGVPVVEGGRVVGVVSAADLVAFQGSTAGTLGAADPAAMPGAREAPTLAELDDEPPDWGDGESPPAGFFSQLWADSRADVAEQIDGPESAGQDPLVEHTVDEVMTRHVVAIPPTVDVSTAADRMRSADVHRVLVMDEDVLLGIVTSMDFVRAVADHRIERRTFVFDRWSGERRE